MKYFIALFFIASFASCKTYVPNYPSFKVNGEIYEIYTGSDNHEYYESHSTVLHYPGCKACKK